MKEQLPTNRIGFPSEKTVSSFLKMIRKRSSWYDGRDVIQEDTKNVYLVQENGTVLGVGNVGRYDWFYLKFDNEGQSCNKTLHHFPPWSSRKYNIAVLNDDTFYVEPPELDILTDILTEKK